MARHLTLFVLALAIWLAAPVSAQDEELEKAVGELRVALGDSESDAASVDILKGFLKEFPETKYTAPVLNAIAYYQGEAGEDHDGALAFVEGHIATLAEQDHIKASKIVVAGMYDKPEHQDKLRAVVAELNGMGDLRFRDYTSLVFSAFGAEQWDLAHELIEPARSLSTVEAVKGQYPEAEDETIEERSADRMLDLDVYKGWASANTGDHNAALELFKSADGRAKRDYFNTPEGMLNVYWGKTLMMTGDSKGALDKLLPMALWTESKTAEEAVMELFEKDGGCLDDFDHYLYENRVKHARIMDDFAAVDYKDTRHESKDLMGKVTLVAFWFPT
jgi:hypothetical protein